jgi:spore maturation protein CgeB
MRIMYVDLQYDYGDPSRGQNFIGQLGFKRAFETLGHEVVSFYYDQYLDNLSLLQELVVREADQCEPDLVFFCLFRDQFEVDTLERLRSKWTTMNWFGDDAWRFEHYSTKFAPHFDIVVTTDKYAVPKYKKLGVGKVVLSQWAAVDIPVEALPDSQQYDFDVSFVGGVNPVRKWFVRKLLKSGFRVECFGNGWRNGIISIESMAQVFQRSKINLNLSNSRSLDLRFLVSNPLNMLHALRDMKITDGIKARCFEIGHYGGFQLAEFAVGLEDYFDIGSDLAVYKGLDEAKALIRYYLENDEERETIKKNGIAVSRNNHTYVRRFEDIFQEMMDAESDAGGQQTLPQ